MSMKFSRRGMLQAGSALVGASAFGLGLPRRALAARERVVIRVNRDIQNLDPPFRIGTVEGNILRSVCRRLVMFKPTTLEWETDAAAEIRQPDAKLIEFSLKPGIMFQGGYGELTAEDVKFSFERYNVPGPDGKKSAYAKDWGALESVEITGKYSGRLHLKNPAPALWLIAVSDVSGCILSKRAVEKLGEKTATQLYGAGPYKFAEWIPNQRITLEADPDYMGPKPYFKTVVIKPIQDPKTAELAFRADEIDFTSLEPTSAEAMAKDPSATIIKKDSINYVWIGINVEKAPYTDVRVRQAIRKAIDVDQAILAGYNGTVTPAKSLLAPGLLGNWPDAPVHRRDVAGAKQLLAQAGYADGFKTRLTLLNSPAFKTMGLVVQANLAEAGIEVELDVLDSGSYWSMGKGEAGENLELSMQRFGGKADPGFQTQWFVSEQTGVWNWQRWQSAEYDRLDELASAATDSSERAGHYVRMQQLMDESSAFVWLTHEVNVFASKKWLAPSILPNGDDWQYRYFREA